MIQTDIIDHLNHPTALLIRSLLDREQRGHLEQIIIDDEENITQALSAGVKLIMLITTDETLLSQSLLEKLPSDVPVIPLSKRTGKKLFGGEKISRVFAIAKTPAAFNLTSLIALKKDFITLDNLAISGNIGAIIRTSVAFNIGAIFLLGYESVDIYDRRVIRASRGFVFKIPILCLTADEIIQFCRNNEIQLVALSSYAQDCIESVVKEKIRMTFILGSEKTGCSQTLTDAADVKAKIVLNPAVESLNVSVAASVVLYLRDMQHRI